MRGSRVKVYAQSEGVDTHTVIMIKTVRCHWEAAELRCMHKGRGLTHTQ